MKVDLARNLGLGISKTKVPEWTQDYVSETDIVDGVVISEDNKGRKHYIKVLEIAAVNFGIMSEIEQDVLISEYKSLLKVGPESFHLKIITTEANIEEYLDAARQSYENETNPECRELIENYINFLYSEAKMDSYKKHYYYIFEFDDIEEKRPKDEEEIIAILNHKAREIAAGFMSLGNDVVLLDPAEHGNWIIEKIYDYYNRGYVEQESLEDRINRIEKDVDLISEKYPASDIPFTIKNILAPKSMDFNESPSYVVVNGVYRDHFFIKGKTIPCVMDTVGGWLDSVICFGYGYDVDIYFNKADTARKLTEIRNHLKFSKYSLNNAEQEQENADEIVENYQGTMYLKQAIKAGRESVYDMSVLVTVHADTLDELELRKKAMKKAALTLDIDLIECKRYQEEAFASAGYSMNLAPKIANVAARNITTSGVAAAYPFTAFSLADKSGVAIGSHRDNCSMVIYDPFDRKYSNSNICIFGASGRGKTYSLLTLTSRLRYCGIQNFILSPDKQDEFRRIAEAVGGEFIDIASTSNQCINPFDIRPMESPENALLGGESYQEKSWVIDKIDTLKIFFEYVIGDLTRAEAIVIETLLIRLYKNFGMTEDNNTIYEDESHTRRKKMPIMADFFELIKEEVQKKRLRSDIATVLSTFIEGTCQNMNGQTNVDLDNKYIVFGLEHIKKDMLAPTMFLILDFVWAKCRENRTQKKIITIDEGWQLLDGTNDQVGAFVQQIFKVIRGFGGGAIFATQSIVDLFAGANNYGNAILSCAHSKIVLGLEKKDHDLLGPELGLTEKEAKAVLKMQKGNALFCAGASHIPITVEASRLEHELFTTNREDLLDIAHKKAAERGF